MGQGISEQSPEPSSSLTKNSVVKAKHQMVVSANPYVSKVGNDILQQGGNAIDAAIACAVIITLVEPQSAGIGGGGFILFFDPKQNILTSIDARETAASQTSEEQFLDQQKKPIPYAQAVFKGSSVGVPGLLKGLALAHQKYGKLPWETLLQPTIDLAREGFIVSPRLHTLILKDPFLKSSKNARDYFFDTNLEPIPVGYRLKNRPLANVLNSVAKNGIEQFYTGDVASDIVKAVASHESPGQLALEDLKNYTAIERPVVCGPYRQWRICGMGPPSSGGLSLIALLGMLQYYPLSTFSTLDYYHYFAEAGRLAYADRDKYIADPTFIQVPIRQLIEPYYLSRRSLMMQKTKSLIKALPGTLENLDIQLASDFYSELPATTHISIVDKEGKAISMTLSVASAFGSRIMTNGFFLNNEMTDFSFNSKENDQWIANRIEPNKRPRSSMAPTFVFDQQNRLVMNLGSAGGPAIINYVAKTITGVLDRQLTIQEAIDFPNMGSRNQETEIEKDTNAQALVPHLENRQHPILVREMNSGTQGIHLHHGALWGGVDSRREGIAVGY